MSEWCSFLLLLLPFPVFADIVKEYSQNIVGVSITKQIITLVW